MTSPFLFPTSHSHDPLWIGASGNLTALIRPHTSRTLFSESDTEDDFYQDAIALPEDGPAIMQPVSTEVVQVSPHPPLSRPSSAVAFATILGMSPQAVPESTGESLDNRANNDHVGERGRET